MLGGEQTPQRPPPRPPTARAGGSWAPRSRSQRACVTCPATDLAAQNQVNRLTRRPDVCPHWLTYSMQDVRYTD